MIPAGLTFLALLVTVGTVVASATPIGTLTGREQYDVTVTASVSYSFVTERWSIESVGVVDAGASKIVAFGAWFRNALWLGTDTPRPVVFTIERPSGGIVDTIEQSSGRGGLFDNEKTVRATFRTVEPGDYLLRAKILGDDGRTLVEKTTAFGLGMGGA